MSQKGLNYIYNNVNLKQGLFIEYKRYSCQQYIEYFTMFNEINKFN